MERQGLERQGLEAKKVVVVISSRRNFIGLCGAVGAAAVIPVVADYQPIRRLSVDGADPSYTAWCALINRGYVPIVRLDGVEQHEVETADIDLGYIVRAILGDEGEVFCIEYNKRYLDKIAREVVYGKVEIEVKRRA